MKEKTKIKLFKHVYKIKTKFIKIKLDKKKKTYNNLSKKRFSYPRKK